MRDFTVHLIGVRRVALAALLVLASITAWAATKGPDGGGYTATDATVYSFVDISGGSGGASVLGGTDDGTAPLTLPFTFQFYGKPYTLLCVSSNGAVYFVADQAACAGFNDFANIDITGTAGPNDLPALFPLWSDLTFQVQGAGGVFYQTLGTAGSRKFVVQWNNAYPQGASNPVTFQLVLLEGTNNVLFQYQSVGAGQAGPASNGGQATIGIRNAGALTTQQQIEWSFAAPVLADNSALLFAPSTASATARMDGTGRSEASGFVYGFDFHVQVSTRVAERGKLTLHVDRSSRPPQAVGDFVTTSIDQISFSNDAKTVTFSGSGSWNRATGHTFTAQATDAGEPGRGRDQFSITIRNPAGATVATVSGTIAGGNIQSSQLK